MTTVIGVGLVGAGSISRVYADALVRIPGARLVAVASRSQASAESLARTWGVEHVFTFEQLDGLLARDDIDAVCVNSTNHLHAEHAIAALEAGKHAVVEKPLCLTLASADSMLAAARRAGRGLAYAENLCFAPHYRRARELVREGAVGRVLHARQCEKHGGPYSDWFWQVGSAGGGALMDMGCHSLECLRWLLDKPRVARVSARIATVLHDAKTSLDDDAQVTLELEGDTTLVSESSWAVQSGMQSTLEVYGTEGALHVDLLGETGLRVQRRDGGSLRLLPDPIDANGYRQQLEHFFDAFVRGTLPEESAEDGRVVLELMLAAYASAGCGQPIELPFDPGPVRYPIDLWRAAARV